MGTVTGGLEKQSIDPALHSPNTVGPIESRTRDNSIFFKNLAPA